MYRSVACCAHCSQFREQITRILSYLGHYVVKIGYKLLQVVNEHHYLNATPEENLMLQVVKLTNNRTPEENLILKLINKAYFVFTRFYIDLKLTDIAFSMSLIEDIMIL